MADDFERDSPAISPTICTSMELKINKVFFNVVCTWFGQTFLTMNEWQILKIRHILYIYTFVFECNMLILSTHNTFKHYYGQ
jgi:hypothetical protein